MPCNSDGAEADYRERQNNEFAKAALCALMTALSEQGRLNVVLEGIDWKEAGLSKGNLFQWWEAHQEIDRRRRLAEADEREVKKRQTAALSKLSDDEKRLLGLK